MIPLQLAVFANVPYVFRTSDNGYKVMALYDTYLHRNIETASIGTKNAAIIITIVLIYYGSIQFIWLNFATNSIWWLPYRFYLLEF